MLLLIFCCESRCDPPYSLAARMRAPTDFTIIPILYYIIFEIFIEIWNPSDINGGGVLF